MENKLLHFVTERGLKVSCKVSNIIQCAYSPHDDSTFIQIAPDSRYICEGRGVLEDYLKLVQEVE